MFYVQYRKFAITWYLCFNIKITIPDGFVNNVNSSLFMKGFSMGYSSYLKPRKEAISEEGIEGIIDLANLKDESKSKVEARPDDFFQLTYPTSDVKKVLNEINTRFSFLKES